MVTPQKRSQVMLLILIKDLVKKRSFCCVEGSDVLGSPSLSTGVFTFFGGGGGAGEGQRASYVPTSFRGFSLTRSDGYERTQGTRSASLAL